MSRFKPYPKYKDSGVEWLGEVPSGWSIKSLKHYCSIVSGSTPKSDVQPYWDGGIIWITPGDLSQLKSRDIRDSIRTISTEGLQSCGTTLVTAGSVVLSTRAPIGSLGIARTSLCTNQGCKTLLNSKDTSPELLYYLLGAVTAELNIRGRGTTFLELSTDALGAFRVAFPEVEEQTQIAKFLDYETARIDALIQEQQRLLELLKEKRQAVISHAVTEGLDPTVPMKDSGVEWLGKVPAHWEVKKMKYVVSIRAGFAFSSTLFEDSGIPVIRISDIQGMAAFADGCKRITVKLTSYEDYEVYSGDILMAMTGGTIGKAGIYRSEEVALLNQRVCKFIPSDILLPEILWSNVNSNPYKEHINLTAFGGAQPNISDVELLDFEFCYPVSKMEQKSIVDFLLRMNSRLDDLTHEAEKMISLLQERRSALISAAVTGKIDVRTWRAPESAPVSLEPSAV